MYRTLMPMITKNIVPITGLREKSLNDTGNGFDKFCLIAITIILMNNLMNIQTFHNLR